MKTQFPLGGVAVASLLSLSLALSSVLFLAPSAWADSPGANGQDDYDRLDGHGASGEKVQVIEWESNLEIHVYPAGSLAGLALKLDQRNKAKPVMVIGYRFKADPGKQLIRRAILGIPFQEGFQAFRDSSETEFDKIVISNNGLSGELAVFRLDPQPVQLYPDEPARTPAQASGSPSRSPGGTGDAGSVDLSEPDLDDSGTIQPFLGGGKRQGRAGME